MIDTLLKHQKKAEETDILDRLGLACNGGKGGPNGAPGAHPVREFILLTLHRPSNVDSSEGFRPILEAVREIGKNRLVIFPCHPRTRQRIRDFGLDSEFAFCEGNGASHPGESKILCTAPLGYLDFVHLMAKANLVLTDSGGVQEETTILGVPCLTLRENTERPATIIHGTNILAGSRRETIIEAHHKLTSSKRPATRPPLWDGMAGKRIAAILANQHSG
jgi:UDP-N-acetylglucosamine 2-epimerase (non-hydrolysing)